MALPPARFVLEAFADLPHIGAWRRDMLIVAPGADVIQLYRRLPPNYGFIAGALAAGELVPVSRDLDAARVCRAIGWDLPLGVLAPPASTPASSPAPAGPAHPGRRAALRLLP